MNWWMRRHVKTISEFRAFDWSKWGFIHMWLWVKCFLIEVPTNQFSKSFERWNICCGQRWEESREPHSSLLFLFPYVYRVECTASAVMRAEGVKQQLRSQVCGGELLDRAVGRWVARLTWGLHEASVRNWEEYLCLQVLCYLFLYLFLLKYFKINSWRKCIFIPAQKETNVQLK